ncbi:MAG: ATP-binding protein [Planctomycetes bacterium]|nr:ATP-binding protein [Planctomycetota bacterium]
MAAAGGTRTGNIYHVKAERESPPEQTGPFESEDQLLETARQMFSARAEAAALRRRETEQEEQMRLADEAERWGVYWHRAFEMTDDDLPFCEKSRRLGFSEIEREILVMLVLERLGLLRSSIRTCADVLEALKLPTTRMMEAIRSMAEDSLLVTEKMIFSPDPDEDPSERNISVNPALVQSFITGEVEDEAWSVESEDELYEKLRVFSQLFKKKSDAMRNRHRTEVRRGKDVLRLTLRVDHLKRRLNCTLREHPNWGLSRLMAELDGANGRLKQIVVVLLGKELGHRDSDDRLYTGRGLAQSTCIRIDDVRQNLDSLKSDAKLIAEGLVQPAGGKGMLLDDDPDSIAGTEYELGEKSIELLGIERRQDKEHLEKMGIREPKMTFEQLVLSEEVSSALEMALAQAKSAKVLMKKWGLSDVIAYGRSVTLLFSGPPGTGKTASAEALAAELGRPIMVSDYSRIQNCFVGQTEKNIVKTFRQAQVHGAVLFWDEADAMFYSRDSGYRSWEVRDVNVLLQELEKFEGVCVLATNRKISLDSALERRIGLKVEFERPDREMRREIWARLVPPGMPLADDVDLDRLSEPDLSGGEIKNAVLNAGRRALTRGEDARVKMRDFAAAIEMETEGKWTREGKCIGFAGNNN